MAITTVTSRLIIARMVRRVSEQTKFREVWFIGVIESQNTLIMRPHGCQGFDSSRTVLPEAGVELSNILQENSLNLLAPPIIRQFSSIPSNHEAIPDRECED